MRWSELMTPSGQFLVTPNTRHPRTGSRPSKYSPGWRNTCRETLTSPWRNWRRKSAWAGPSGWQDPPTWPKGCHRRSWLSSIKRAWPRLYRVVRHDSMRFRSGARPSGEGKCLGWVGLGRTSVTNEPPNHQVTDSRTLAERTRSISNKNGLVSNGE